MWLFIQFSNKTHHLNFFLSSKSLSVLLCLVYKSVWFVFFFSFLFSPLSVVVLHLIIEEGLGDGGTFLFQWPIYKNQVERFLFSKAEAYHKLSRTLKQTHRRRRRWRVGPHSVDRVSSSSSPVKWVELLSQRETCYTSSARRCFAMIGMLRAWRKLINPNRFYA